jgi:hypothetical protein
MIHDYYTFIGNYILAIMKNYILLFVLPVILLSCGIARNINCIKLKKTKVHLTHDRKMWTEHLKLKKGNYFIYYGSIFGIERIATTRGNYTVKGDSLYLFYVCEKRQPEPVEINSCGWLQFTIALSRSQICGRLWSFYRNGASACPPLNHRS